MKRKSVIALLLAALTLLTGCGGKGKGTAPVIPVTPTVTEAPIAIISTPKISEEYNSIDSANQQEKSQVKDELLAVARGCRDIYAQADKGTAINVVLSRADVQAMVDRIGQMGYPAVDAFGKLDMRNPQPILNFGEKISGAENIGVSYFTVYNDGQISVYHIGREKGIWYLIAMSAVWDRSGEPYVLSEGRYAIGEVQLTEKGWLIYNRDTGSFDDNQRSNTNAYVFVRVLPYDSVKRGLGQRYVEPVGYFENNLFTTSWSEANMGPIDFNSLYAALFGMYMGTDDLSASNASNYFSTVQDTRLFLVPTGNFEQVVKYYFNIDSAVLKNISDYSYALDGYFFFGYQDGLYNVTPRIPEPEVVDYWYNSDGTLTMRIDAVHKWYGTDRAFTHDLTVREHSDGSFRYVSNSVYLDENSIVPTYRISDLLNSERAKTDY